MSFFKASFRSQRTKNYQTWFPLERFSRHVGFGFWWCCFHYGWFWTRTAGRGCTENKKADKLKSPVLCACSDGNHLYVGYKHKLSGFGAASLQRLAFFLPSVGGQRAWATFHAGSKIEMRGGEKRKWQHPPPGLCSVTKYRHLQSRDFSWLARSCQLVTGLFFYSFKLSFLFNCSLCSQYQYSGSDPAN